MSDLGMTGPEPPVPVVRGDALARADAAWRARVSGMTWREAAEVAGYASAEHAIDAVRKTYGTLPKLDRDEQRRIWRDRLEVAWRQVAEDMRDRVPGSVTAAVRVATCAIALDGLAEATKIDLQVTEVFDGFLRELTDAGYLGP